MCNQRADRCSVETLAYISCSRASTPGIDSCISMEVATLRATCSLHAGFMSITFSKCRSYFPNAPCMSLVLRPYAACIRRYAGFSRLHASDCVLQEAYMQGACISSVNPALVEILLFDGNFRFCFPLLLKI